MNWWSMRRKRANNDPVAAARMRALQDETPPRNSNMPQSSLLDSPDSEHQNVHPSYYTLWQSAGISQPEQRSDVQDWLQTIGLTSQQDYLLDPVVRNVKMGLGWDIGADIDGSAVLLDSGLNVNDLVWFKKLKSSCGSVVHSGDNLTGEGGGDDEVIRVDLDAVPHYIHHILFTVCVYSFNMSFNDIKSAYVRMLNDHHRYKDSVLCHFSLSELSGQAMLMAQLTRKGGYWNFRALGTPTYGRTVTQIVKNRQNINIVGNCVAVPPVLKRINICVLKGTNLAAKDEPGLLRKEASSDPYFIIHYGNKSYSSEYKQQTLNPVWAEEPFDMGPVTETTMKPLKITVFDYDYISTDDFMGFIRIPANALYNEAPGERVLTFELGPSKDKHFKKEEVSGELHIRVTVTLMPTEEAFSKYRV